MTHIFSFRLMCNGKGKCKTEEVNKMKSNSIERVQLSNAELSKLASRIFQAQTSHARLAI